jgi:putative DNA primase/helicase
MREHKISPDVSLGEGRGKDSCFHSTGNGNFNEKICDIKPVFEDLSDPKTLIDHIDSLINNDSTKLHSEILKKMLDMIETVDFRELAYPEVRKMKEEIKKLGTNTKEAAAIQNAIDKLPLPEKVLIVISIEEVLRLARKNLWGLCKRDSFIYLFNGAFWDELKKDLVQKFLGEAVEKMGVEKFDSRYFRFRDNLFKQFLSAAYLPAPEADKNKVMINLRNGTFEITPEGTNIRSFDSNDFLIYQLPFDYDPSAKAPIFSKYLDEVLPDKNSQKVLAEFMGYVFIKNGSKAVKEEKALILYGTGANGKSVFYHVICALLGDENTSNFTLQNLTNENGYYRAKLANKLVNYASEINSKLEASYFKQLVSGEPVDCRLPYKDPMIIREYAKLIFNVNELPRDVEHTNAFFRRFLIIPFDVTIPEEKQDKELHNKIIDNELSGVFNWVLEGLSRLLSQKKFTNCDKARKALDQYKLESNSIRMFLEDNGYEKSPSDKQPIKDFYQDYRTYCIEDGLSPFKKSNFIKQLKGMGYTVDRSTGGNLYVFVERKSSV